MWTTFALVATLSLAQGESGSLQLTHARTTYGTLGATRTNPKFLPGDNFVLSFDIEGIKADDDGKVLYSVAMEVKDGEDKVKFKQEPRNLESTISLGGTSLPGYASVQIGLDQPAGKYQVKVTVTDRAAKKVASFAKTYEVLPKGFGIVHLTTTSDEEGKVPSPLVGAGQSLWVNFDAVGFGRDKKDQPNLSVTLRVLDENGKPTLAKPFLGEVNASHNVPKNVQSLPLQFALYLNRSGKFTVELKATDKMTDKTSTVTFPLEVLKTK